MFLRKICTDVPLKNAISEEKIVQWRGLKKGVYSVKVLFNAEKFVRVKMTQTEKFCFWRIPELFQNWG